MIWKRRRVGLALGGGGARGLAHIGVLRVFEEESLPIDLIAGTSIGALVGAAFASGLGSVEMEERTLAFLESPAFQDSALKTIKEAEAGERMTLTQKIQAFFKNQFYLAKALFRPGMLQSEEFHPMIDYFLPDIRIEEMDIPFYAVTVDLLSGMPVVLSSGPLREAVMASCAVPGAVAPVEKDGMLLSDGGITHLVPTSVARGAGAEVVVSVNVGSTLEARDAIRTAIDVYVRASNIMGHHLAEESLQDSDVVIRPDVGHLHWTDFPLATDLIAEGERAAREKVGEIRRQSAFYRRFLRPRRARRQAGIHGPSSVENGPS